MAFFPAWPSQLWVVINFSWTAHIFISATRSIKQDHTNGVQLSTVLAYFSAVMRILMTSNYISLPALRLTLIIFDSFEVHLLIYYVNSPLLLCSLIALKTYIPSNQHIPQLLIGLWCLGMTVAIVFSYNCFRNVNFPLLMATPVSPRQVSTGQIYWIVCLNLGLLRMEMHSSYFIYHKTIIPGL